MTAMEGAPVTAATGALGPVVAKLGALLGSDYKLRRRTRKDVKFIKSKLKSVHSILWAIWDKEILNAESKDLKKEALDLAADMDDAIDDFILTMEPSRRNKRLIQREVDASRPFQVFKTRVDGVSGRCRTKWKWKNKCAEPISSLFSRKNDKSSASIKPPPPQAPFVRKDASELFGMGTWRDDLISYLVGGGGGAGGAAAAGAAAEAAAAKAAFAAAAAASAESTMMRTAALAAAAEINSSAAESSREQQYLQRLHVHRLKQKQHEQQQIAVALAAAAEGNASDAELAVLTAAEVAEEEAAAEKEAESTVVQPQLKMASIVGMAGVGKTTLARLVYDEIENKFQSRAFVSVTPSPNMKEVLTSILQQVGAEPLAGTEAMTKEDIIDTISNFLEDKRYLVIIDDIWHRGEWETISKSFPKNNLGSRIVMTTRIHSIQGDDFDNNKLYRMIPKCCYEWTWLYGPGNEDIAARMKPDMVGEGFDCDHPIVHMCGGVPLALLCMFSAVAIVRGQQEQLGVPVKARDVQDMIEKQVKQSGIQNTPGFEPLVGSLQLGYDDLPHHMLKTCLLYCSIYPENYRFHMNDLVMRWVAEGFTYKEDAAKGYLEELGNRGLMLWGNHGAYQMSSMIRNFLRWKSHEDNFITCSSDITSAYACPIHRLCIDYYPVDDGVAEGVDPLSGIDWSQIRSFVVFEPAERLPFEKLERVRVLDLRFNGTSYLGNDHMKNICGLLRVRHLFGLKGSRISEIPPEIEGLQYLETLQLRGTSIRELPGEIRNLLQLKSLDVSRNQMLRTLPREIGGLQQLETLCMSGTVRTKLPWDIIGRLKKLKTLGVRDMCITELPREIGGLQYLETLDLSGNIGITNLPPEIGDLQHLETLDLSGTKVAKIPREIRGLKKLESLKLDDIIGTLPWEAGQLSKLKGVPEFVRQAWKKSDLVFELAGEILSIRMTRRVGDSGGLIVGTKHMHIPQWIKDHFNNLGSLDIRICKLEEQDLKILREMPILHELTLRLEVVPRNPIAISGQGFPSLTVLFVDSRVPPAITFEEGAMPRLKTLRLEFQFYGGPPNKEPLGIKHLRCLDRVEFKCNQEWYRGAESSPCITVVINVVRKEAQEHPNGICFYVCGRECEIC